MEAQYSLSLCKYRRVTVAFKLNLPCCGTCCISEQVLDQGCRSEGMSCAVNYTEIEVKFPSAGWISSHEIGFIWKLLVNLWKEFIRQVSHTLLEPNLFFCSEAEEKWAVKNNLIPAPWKRAMWMQFSKLGVEPSCSFILCLFMFLCFRNGSDCFPPSITIWGGWA